VTLADRFLAYSAQAAAEGSPGWAELAAGLAADEAALAVVERAPESRRQPVLVLATCRWLGAPPGPWPRLRSWLLDHADAVVAELGRRSVQTNDVRRSGPVSLALARLDEPVALLEVGASAGLCLLPDLVSYRAGDVRWGDPHSPVQLTLDVTDGRGHDALGGAGAGLGAVELPEVVWRAGLDLDPVDVRDDEAVAWLRALLPPGATERADLLERAVALARTAPPRVARGDAVDDLEALAATAPADARLVVVSTGTLVYLPGRRRQQFVDTVRGLGATWVSYERIGLLDDVGPVDPGLVERTSAFAVLAVDGRPLAVGDAHGTRLTTVG
jgi:hypothetical protein